MDECPDYPPGAPVKFFDYTETNPFPIVSFADLGGQSSMVLGITCLNMILEGTEAWERIGRTVLIHSVEFKATWICPKEIVNRTPLRVMLVYDRSPNCQYISTGDFMEPPPINNLGFYTPPSMFKRSRYQVLRDRVFPLSLYGGSSAVCNQKEYCVGPWPTVYAPPDAPVALGITSGALFLLAFVPFNHFDTNMDLDNGVLTAYSVRVVYTDL